MQVAGINLAATADTAVASGFTWQRTQKSWKVHAVASGAVLCCLPNDSQG